MSEWHKCKTPGLRFRYHESRRHGLGLDKYFTLRFKTGGREITQALGWASEGWNEDKAAKILFDLKANARTGQGEITLSERRKKAEEERRKKEEAEAQERLDMITFSEVFEKHYFPNAKINKGRGSLVREEQLYRTHIKPVVGDTALLKISPFAIEKIKKNMAENGLSARTIHYCLAVIRQLFNFAVRHDFFKGINPVSKVKKPVQDNQRMRFLTFEEADRLLAALKQRSLQLHDITLLSLHCGLRFGEIAALQWSCVDTDNDTVLIKDTKSKRNRTAFMTGQVKAMFQSLMRGNASDLVFPDRDGKVMFSVSKTFNAVIEELKFNQGITDARQRVCFHTCRHSFASWLAQSNIDLYQISQMLGHSTLAMAKRYSHLRPDTFKRAVKILEQSMHEEQESIIFFQKK